MSLNLNYVGGSQYLGGYLVPREDLETSVRPKVDELAYGVSNLSKIPKQYPQSAYAGLGILLQL